MLLIRQAQLEALGRHSRAAFEERLCDAFVQAYPRECRQADGPEAMLRWTRTGVAAAVDAGYSSERACGRWLLMMMMLGVDFAVDPQLPWMRDCLGPAGDPDPTDRMDAAFEEAVYYLGATAGEDARRVVRAMVRIRDFDFACVPELEEQDAIDDACRRLQALYPEKFAFQGIAAMTDFVASQRIAARAKGLAGAGGVFLFVLLAFILGIGFHRDPLHPWAAEILDPAIDQPSDARAARLEAAARAHMALSLEGQ